MHGGAIQSLFTKFFEKKRSNDNTIQIYSKKKRKNNLGLDHSAHGQLPAYHAHGSASPSPRRPSSNYSKEALSNSSSKAVSQRIERIPVTVTKNFLQPMSPNHLKVRQAVSPGSIEKHQITKYYRYPELRNSPKLSPSPRETSHDTLNRPTLPKKPSPIPGSDSLKVLKKSPSRETSNRRVADLVEERSPKRKSDLDKYLLERKKANKEFILNAKKNSPEACLKLLSQEGGRISADINYSDKDGWTALHHAAYNQNVKFVNILLYNDAKVDVQDTNGVSPLILAVARGNAQITQVSMVK